MVSFTSRGNRDPIPDFYGDFISGRIWAVDKDLNFDPNVVLDSALNIASFGTDANQELYVCSFDGSIYTIEETTSN